MGRRLLINGVNRWEDLVDRSSLSIESQLTYQLDTCKFKLRGDRPYEGDEIIVEDDMVGRLFAGIVAKVTLSERTPENSTSIWDVDCGDYTLQINRKLVVETYENVTADYIFKDIVLKYCPEFTINGVRSGAPVIEKIVFNYEKPSECFKDLCDYIVWQWYVDYYKDLKFFSTDDLTSPAPMKLITGGQFYDLKHSIDQTTIKNRIYVLGGTMLSDPWTYEIKADGTARTWTLPHEPSDLTISVGGVQKTVGQENVDKEEDFDFLYNKQEKYVKCSAQTPTPAAGTTISFTYRYPIPVITEFNDEESQQKIAAIQGGDGVYEDKIVDDSLITIEAAEAAGQAQLREYANPKVTGSFQTEVPGWFPGQLVEIDLPDRGIQDTFLIQKVAISPYTPEHWTYKVEYGGRLKGIDSFLQALVSAQQKKKLNDTSVINKVNTLKDTASITDEIISTPRTPGWVVEQSLEFDVQPLTAVNRTETTQADFQAGTMKDVFATANGDLQLNNFYDNPTNSIDVTKWATGGTVTTDGTNIVVGATKNGISWLDSRQKWTIPNDGSTLVVEFYGTIPFTTLGYPMIGLANREGSGFAWSDYQNAIGFNSRREDNRKTYVNIGKTLYPLDAKYADGTFRTYRIEVTATNVKFYVNGTLKTTVSHSLAGQQVGFVANAYDANQYTKIDWVKVYKTMSGFRTSPALDLSSVGVAANSQISWTATTPFGTSVVVETSLDGGQTWQQVTNGGPIPGITPGTDLTGKSLLVRQTLTTNDPSVTPTLSDITVSIEHAPKEFVTVGSLFNIWQTDSGAWPQPQYQISTDGGQIWGDWIAVDAAQRGYIEVPHPCRVRMKANGPVKVRNWKKPWGETDTVCGFVVCA